MSKIVIGITGHRLLSPMQKEKIKPVIRKAIENIMYVSKEQDKSATFVAISPIAEGADTLFADAAQSLGLPLQIILPFEKAEYLKTFSSSEVYADFNAIYDNVDDTNKRELKRLEGNEINQLFLELGHTVVDDSDYMIAVWNEDKGKGKGGTADVVAYAVSQKKKILLINPDNLHPYINYLSPDATHQKSKKIDDPSDTNHIDDFILQNQNSYDARAAIFNKKYRQLWTFGFVLGLVGVFASSVSIAYHLMPFFNFLFSSIEAVTIVMIVLLVIFGNSSELHHTYVYNRIVSERLRIKRFFSELGFLIYDIKVSPIYFAIKEKPEYNILDNTIQLINLSAYSHWSFEKKKKHLEKELIIDQYKYHERKKEKFEKRNSLYKRIRKYLFLLLVVNCLLHYAHVFNDFFLHEGIQLSSTEPAFFHIPHLEENMVFISLLIPSIVAACEALKYLYEWEKIITQSGSMSTYFREKEKRLKHIHSEIELQDFLNAINADMLIENLDWEKYMQDKSEVPAG